MASRAFDGEWELELNMYGGMNGSQSSEASDSVNGGMDCQGDFRFSVSDCGGVAMDEIVDYLIGRRELIEIWEAHCASLREEFWAVEPFALDEL